MNPAIENESLRKSVNYLQAKLKETEKENYNLNIAINGIEQLYQAAEAELKRLKRSKGEELEKMAKIIEGLKNELLKKDEALLKKNKIIEQYNLDIELFVKQRKEVGEIRSVLRTLT